MKTSASRLTLGLITGASLALASSVASAQFVGEMSPDARTGPEVTGAVPADQLDAPAGAPSGMVGPEFAQIIPPACFDAAGEFTVDLAPAVCGVFEGAPGTEGGVGPTGTIIRQDAAPAADFATAPQPGMELAPEARTGPEITGAVPADEPEAGLY